jgi:hypothetical protein
LTVEQPAACNGGRRRVANQRATSENFLRPAKPCSGPQTGSNRHNIDAGRPQKGEILARGHVFSGDPVEISEEFKDLYEQLRNPLMHASQYVDDSVAALNLLARRLAFIRARTAEAAAAVGR